MRYILLTLFIVMSVPVFAAEELERVVISEVEALRIENVSLRVQLTEMQRALIVLERERLVQAIAEKHGVKWSEYDLDLANKVFVRRKEK